MKKLRVFLCHSSQDKPIVRELYQRLNAEGWIDPWLDEEKLLPGQDWDMEIEKAVETADVVVVCLSNKSVTKEGYIQKELRFVLDISDEKPEETIFITPIRMDDCSIPRRLKKWQYVDLFPLERKEWAYSRLFQAMKIRLEQVIKQEAEKRALKEKKEHDHTETEKNVNLKAEVRAQKEKEERERKDIEETEKKARQEAEERARRESEKNTLGKTTDLDSKRIESNKGETYLQSRLFIIADMLGFAVSFLGLSTLSLNREQLYLDDHFYQRGAALFLTYEILRIILLTQPSGKKDYLQILIVVLFITLVGIKLFTYLAYLSF